MKAARLHTFDETLRREELLRLEELPDPKVQAPDDVIVRIGGAGLCRTDLHIVEGIWRAKVDRPLPYVLGHENAGWVQDVGETVRTVKPGDPVIVHPLVTDGTCPACRLRPVAPYQRALSHQIACHPRSQGRSPLCGRRPHGLPGGTEGV